MKNDAMQRRAGGVKLSSIIFCVTVLVAGLPVRGGAQVNSGSNGSDGAFNPTVDTVLNMAAHPDGIYQFTSVNIRSNLTISFIPNANNTPVVWLVQSNVVINGVLDVSGKGPNGSAGGLGGPGGYHGGTGGPSPTSGQGPGGGFGGNPSATFGGNGSYGVAGYGASWVAQPGPTYGNLFLIPLLGGSGGGGCNYVGGGGGGGAILIAASGTVQVNGQINSVGAVGGGDLAYGMYGVGSGGAIRIVASRITGAGQFNVWTSRGGGGRVRFDTYENVFGGSFSQYTVFSQGFQPIIIPSAGQLPQLMVISVGGVPISPSPTGVLSTPDAVLSAQQNNPIPIIVSCASLPLNTLITVSVKPANGAAVSATGYNTTGTLASSTATVSINMPRGGGLIYATAATSH